MAGSEMIKNMKKKDPEAYHRLVKGLFCKELDFEESCFISEPQSSRKDSRKDSTCSLTESRVDALYQVIEFLGLGRNITEEGIFRKAGSLKKQHDLMEMIDKGEELNLDDGLFTIHECASVLKTFLGKLPEPLVTDSCYPAHLAVAVLHKNYESQEEKSAVFEKQIFCTQLLLELIPEEYFNLLKDLLFLLHGVSQRKEDNKMSSTNLGTMFSTHILCPKSISPEDLQAKSGLLAKAATFLIENPTILFNVPPKLLAEVKSLQFRRSSEGRVSLVKRTSQGGPGLAFLIASTAFSFNEKGEFSAPAKNEEQIESRDGSPSVIEKTVFTCNNEEEAVQHEEEDGIGSNPVCDQLKCTVMSQLNLNLNILNIKK